MGPALHIALEGLDGSGTTTQVPRLAAALTARGYQVVTTAQPSAGDIGAMARRALHQQPPPSEATLALLFAADRLEHHRQVVTPQLQAGCLVLSDRDLLSSFVYQGSVLPLDWIRQINRHARPPDVSVLLQVHGDTAARRRAARGAPAQLFDARARQQQVAAAYDRAFSRSDVGATLRVDGEPSIPMVTTALLAALHPYFPPPCPPG